MSNIFEKRVNYKPFEYPEIVNFTDMISQTYWTHSELDFTADKQDFFVSLSSIEQNAVKNALLAISQIEVNVKEFWGRLYKYLPKPEMNNLGSSFSDCEHRHAEAYSRLLDITNLSVEFKKILQVPAIRDRIEFLSSYLKKKVSPNDKKSYALSLIVFSLFIENVSLFSQFAIILSFTHFKGLMKNISNVIAWSSSDEQIHANAGIFLFNKIVEENPEILDQDMIDIIIKAAHKAIEVESDVLDWIFESGEIETCAKKDLIVFMKDRINKSFKNIGLKKVFQITKEDIKKMQWFDEEIQANSHDDFFAKRPVDYSKFTEAVTEDSLF